jgi:PAS domain S-box-containing protein
MIYEAVPGLFNSIFKMRFLAGSAKAIAGQGREGPVKKLVASKPAGEPSPRGWAKAIQNAIARPFAGWVLLEIGLAATVLAGAGAWWQIHSRNEARFYAATEQLHSDVLQELDRYVQVLNAARAVWALHPPANWAEWRAYVERLSLTDSFPGLQALGFIERVPSTRLTAFLEQVRRNEDPGRAPVDFQIHPRTVAEEHYLVRFVEPLDSNQPALGYDISSEPVRRRAADLARDTGKIALSHKLALVQNPQAPGVLLLLPVYSKGIPTTNVALRRAHLQGWVYAAFVVEDMLARVRLLVPEGVDVQIFDGANASPATQLARTSTQPDPGGRQRPPAFQRTTNIRLGSGLWTLQFQTNPEFDRTALFSAPGYVPAIGLGLCITLLTFGMARSLAGRTQRAQALADEMTAQLRLQHHAMDFAKNGLFILDATREDCPIIYGNRAFERMTGYSADAPLGTETLHLLRNHASQTGLPGMRAALQAGGGDHAVVREYRRDGSQFWAEFHLVPVLDDQGRRTHFLGIVEDVTERRRAEEELARVEQRYHELVDNLNVGIYRNTPGDQGRFLEVNPALVTMFDANSKEELMAHGVSDLYADPAQRKDFSEKMARQGFVKDEELELKTLRGRKFWASATAMMKTDGQGTIFFDGAITDISERKRAQQALQKTIKQLQASHQELKETQLQLIQAAKMECIGTLAAGVAHEVKNPLQTIIMGLDYIQRSLPDVAENVRLALSDMRESVWRADTIVRELLQVSANTDFELTEGDLNAVVERSLRLLNSELVAARTTVVCRLEPNLPSVRMDARKMEQVFLNLFINALQAMTQEGNLLVKTRSGRFGQDLHLNGALGGQFQSGERLVVSEVQDTGPGIAPDHLTRIFDPFFTTKAVGEGTGLGLSIVKKIIALHNAAMEVRNAPEGGVVVTLAFRIPSSEGGGNTSA